MKFYSETRFYSKVKETSTQVQLIDLDGQNIVVDKNYLDLLDSAEDFSATKKVTETELLNICLNNPLKAMTIVFIKKDEKKAVKIYNKELEDRAKEVKKAFMYKGSIALIDALKNPVLPYTPGEERVIIGYHKGEQNDKGHLSFFEVESNFWKGINTQNFKELIVNNVKYIKK